MGDKFWAEDFTILFKKERLIEFFPRKEFTNNENLNAITRLVIYASILFFIFTKKQESLYYIIGVLLLTYFLWKNSSKSKENIENESKQNCVAPTKNNPFMNVLMNDYLENPNRQEACDINDETVKQGIEENFNNNLYKDIDDIFDRMNSQRQFYTTPSTTIPNKQDDFANWLYKTPATCKENSVCLRYEDIRYIN